MCTNYRPGCEAHACHSTPPSIDNRGGAAIGNVCTKYGDATAHARHSAPRS